METTNSSYSPNWVITGTSTPPDPPTFGQISQARPAFKALKNQIKTQTSQMISETLRSQSNLPKKTAPINPDTYKIPQHSQNIGSQLYMTNNMDYGRLNPITTDLVNRFAPKDNKFSKANSMLYRNHGLVTSLTVSRVHDMLDLR